MNEQERFLSDIGVEHQQTIDVLNDPFNPQHEEQAQQGATGTEGEEVGDDIIKPRNRRERRLMSKLRDERESAMFLAGKLEAREEANSLITEESDYLKGVEKIYGTDTPESVLATDLLKKAIIGAREDARKAALDDFRSEQSRAFQEKQQLARKLESFIEDIEDSYEVELTDKQEEAFIALLTKMSPKDASGNVSTYADHHTVFEIFQERLKSTAGNGTQRAKEISNRSMVQSGAAKESTLPDDTTARFLAENGII